ncbi:MAG TPA: CRTAC1 family protein [Chthonomonadaceae bacterium]|nr:CRTAC1 family protein [Chthonomonadaceae bacterium]
MTDPQPSDSRVTRQPSSKAHVLSAPQWPGWAIRWPRSDDDHVIAPRQESADGGACTLASSEALPRGAGHAGRSRIRRGAITTALQSAGLISALALAAIAVLAFGCHSAPKTGTPPAQAKAATGGEFSFVDVAERSGIKLRLGHADRSHVNILDGIGHGCAFLDYDGDGRLDVLLVANDGARLYRNRGDGTFDDVTAAALPPPPTRAHFLGCAVADYDGDGRPDIFLTGYGCTALYHNLGGGKFADATRGSGLEARSPHDWTTSAAWADVDGDGRLDLYVCRYIQFDPASKQFCRQKALDGASLEMACPPTTYPSQKGSLYRNEGGGKFRDVTAESGLATAHGKALGCMFCDFNGDGKPDLYVANDLKLGDLFMNVGGGKFRNIGPESGTALGADGGAMSGMGIDWGDYDNDGRFDLLAANYARQPKSLYHNEGGALFTDRSYASGIGAPSLLPLTFGVGFLDVDNDGLLDIVFANGHVDSLAERVDPTMSYFQSAQLFHNAGGGRFADASQQAGPDFTRKIVGRGLAIGDFDGDGREDLLIVDDEGAPLLLHNESTAKNHWLTLRCVWKSAHTYAVGARVSVTAGSLRQVREVRAGGSYLSTNAPDLHCGLGPSATSVSLEIRWPDGRKSRFTGLAPDHTYELSAQSPAARLIR